SEQQIKNAFANDKISYRVEKAEHNSISTGSVDLLTIANALHWFDFDVFYAEANRVLKTNGVIAVWAYGLPFIEPEIDKRIKNFHDHVVGKYWLAENRLVENEYKAIPFPFKQVQAPAFSYKKMITLHEVIGYLDTWSATQRFINENKFNPTEQLQKELAEHWKDAE